MRLFLRICRVSEFTGPNWEGPGLYDPINWFETGNHIGRSWQYGYKGNVVLDEVRIYSVAMTADEIAAEYAAGPNQVFAYSVPWDFNDDGIISILDFAILARQWAISD